MSGSKAKLKSKEIPVIERIIEFTEEDFVTNPDSITKEEWLEFAGNALTFTDGKQIYQFAEEFPIVKYQTTDEEYLSGGSINSFIRSITVSSALDGKRIFIKNGKAKEKRIDSKIVAYYEDAIGLRHAICVHDIERFLLKKPNLSLSPEGLLMFYTEKQILVTNDCIHYARIHGFDTSRSVISYVGQDGKDCLIVLKDTEAVDEDDEAIEYCYMLKFDIDTFDREMIYYVVKKV